MANEQNLRPSEYKLSQEEAKKVNSNTQLYKQAGNSIVVNVLECLLNSLLNRKSGIF